MTNYLEKLQANQVHFPKAYAQFLHNLFYLADSLKDEDEIRINIYNGFEKYRDCVKVEGLKGINLSMKWEQNAEGHKDVAYHAVIKPKVLLAQLNKYCAA